MARPLRRLIAHLCFFAVAAAAMLTPSVASAGAGSPITACLLRAAPGMTARTLFAAAGRFDCTTPQAAFGAGDFWVLSGPLPAGPNSTVRFVSSWQDRTTLYVRYADGAIRRTGFTSRNVGGEGLALGAIIVQRLPTRRAAATRLLWHVEGALNLRGVIVAPRLAGHHDAARSEIGLAMLYGGFAGLVLALLVYGLSLWAALRQRYQLAYCLFLLMLLAYAFTSSAVAGQWLPWLDNNDRQRLNTVFLASSAASAILFARTFFEPRVFAGWLRRASTAAMAALLTAAGAFAVLAPWQAHLLDRLLSAAYCALIALVPAILWHAWTRRSDFRWLFLLAWSAPTGFAVLRLANAYGLLPYSFWLDQSTILSTALEAMMSSLAIAYRIWLIGRERDEARAQEIVARRLADTDPLTGLLNRRAFLEKAIGGVEQQLLVIVDIDHFKLVNDTIGHDGGDEVLRVVARTLRSATPDPALVARIGGEEFAILVPAAAEEVPATILERLRAARMPFDLAVTASIGACPGVLTTEADWKWLYRCADRALFDAKAAGRDRLRLAGAMTRAA